MSYDYGHKKDQTFSRRQDSPSAMKTNVDSKETPEAFLSRNPFKKEWITIGADKDLIDFANQAGEYMKQNNLTTSKIRGVYGEIKRIQMGTYEKEKVSFFLLKPKMAYAVGRETDKSGSCKIPGLKLFQLIFDKCFTFVNSNLEFNNFCNVMEAIIAYHKFHGGKEN